MTDGSLYVMNFCEKWELVRLAMVIVGSKSLLVCKYVIIPGIIISN